VTAPITTSGVNQTKLGGLSLGGNITATAGQFNLVSFVANTTGGTTCTLNGSVRYTGSDFEGCLSGTWMSLTLGGGTNGTNGTNGTSALDLYQGYHSSAQCTGSGGIVTLDGVNKYCRFNTLPAPAGWTKYGDWSTTEARTCGTAGGGGLCGSGSTCSVAGHAWQNKAVETCSYNVAGYMTQGILNIPSVCVYGYTTVCGANKTQGGFY
jgi:hypothetical protein